jgi:CzcA family heavy metal efflux pump
MQGIMGTIVNLRFLVVVLAAALMLFGITRLRSMPVDVFPEFSPPYVEIQTEAPGLSPEDVEQLITVPLEQNLINGVAWLDKIRSESVLGLSSVILLFEPGTDLYRARQMVAERLSQAAAVLPRVSRGPVMLQPMSATRRALIVRLSSQTLSAIEMSVLARWTITPRLMGVPGVANVATWGMRDRQLQVQVDPERLSAHRVSLLQLIESVGNALWVSTLSFVEASTPGNAGFIDTPQQRLGIQHISPIVSPEKLSQVSVQGTGTALRNEVDAEQFRTAVLGGTVRLIDVADVVEDHQPLIGDALAGDGANLLLVIEKFPGSDTVEVTQGVEEAFVALRPGLSGMEIDSTIFRPATFIAMARENLARAGLIACVVMVLMLGACFSNWRAAVISLIAIPLSLVAAALVLYLRGATLNMMVLMGLVLAIGIVVDDAISVVENLLRRLRRLPRTGKGAVQRSQFGVIAEAVLEMRGGMLITTVLCLLAVLPVFSLRGVAGTFFQPFAVSYTLAVVASTCVALVVTPALSAILLPSASNTPRARSASPLIRALRLRYDRLLRRVIARPRPAYVTMAVLAAVGLGVIPLLQPALLPAFKERDLLIRLEAMPGTSHPEMVRLVDRVMRDVRAIPGIRNTAALVGRAVFGDQVVGINSAEVLVNIAPTADCEASVAAIQTAIGSYPGLKGEVQTYLQRTSSQVGAEGSAPIVVRVYGQDWTVLRNEAQELRHTVKGIAGVSEATVSLPVEEPTAEVEVDLDAARRHGINPGTVRRAASTLMNGIQVGSLFQEQKMFDVVVWSTPETRSSVAGIGNLLIDTPFDVPVRLGDVADVRIASRPSLIRHEDVSRYVDIAVDVKGRDAPSVMDAIRARLRRFQFPLEYHATVFGAYQQQQAARNRLLAFAAVALIGIVLLLEAAFEDWRLAMLSFATLPLGLAGGVAALALAGPQSVSLCAVFGLLTVFGIAARNQVMLLRRLRQLEWDKGRSPCRGLLFQATRERFPSVVMTALTTSAALVPVLLMGGSPGPDILWPTALVIVGGIVTCSLVNLLVVPVLYLRVATRQARTVAA